MEKFSDVTGISPIFISQYAMFLGVTAVCLGMGGEKLTTSISVAYPTFMSVLALATDTSEDDRQWLTYWVVFGLVFAFESSVGEIFEFVPFYVVAKCILFLYLMHPRFRGATGVYNRFLLPILG